MYLQLPDRQEQPIASGTTPPDLEGPDRKGRRIFTDCHRVDGNDGITLSRVNLETQHFRNLRHRSYKPHLEVYYGRNLGRGSSVFQSFRIQDHFAVRRADRGDRRTATCVTGSGK